MTTRSDIVTAARGWLGVPWRHQGRNEHGVDCVGLLVVVARALGLSDYDSAAYGRDPSGDGFLKHFGEAGGTRVSPSKAEEGDIAVFRSGPYPVHAGFLTLKHGVRHVLHASASAGKVVEEPVTTAAPLVACFRLPGVE